MAKFIQLQHRNGHEVSVNVDAIVTFHPSKDGGTYIYFSKEPLSFLALDPYTNVLKRIEDAIK